MSVWIRNLKNSLEDRPVLILHGNVRDKYIDADGHVYENLTQLLKRMAEQLPLTFTEFVCYDIVANERRTSLGGATSSAPQATGGDTKRSPPDFAKGLEQKIPPGRLLADWFGRLQASDQNCFAVIHYLDKLVAYSESYSDAEKETLLRLEKLIENIAPNHRLILVALRDTMVPIELYTNSPKTYVLPIPMPGKADREVYLKYRVGEKHHHLDLIVALTDGLFLRDLDNVADTVRAGENLSAREVRRQVNKYRIGEQEDCRRSAQVAAGFLR